MGSPMRVKRDGGGPGAHYRRVRTLVRLLVVVVVLTGTVVLTGFEGLVVAVPLVAASLWLATWLENKTGVRDYFR